MSCWDTVDEISLDLSDGLWGVWGESAVNKAVISEHVLWSYKQNLTNCCILLWDLSNDIWHITIWAEWCFCHMIFVLCTVMYYKLWKHAFLIYQQITDYMQCKVHTVSFHMTPTVFGVDQALVKNCNKKMSF